MNDEHDHHTASFRTAEVRGVLWRLMLTFDLDEWIVTAETEEGESPDPFRTSDEEEAREIYDNFEKMLLERYTAPPSPEPTAADDSEQSEKELEEDAAFEASIERRAVYARKLDQFEQLVATAVIGVDTLWGGDVNNPSGMGRFIADCYFSGKDLPQAYHDPAAEELRATGGVIGEACRPELVREYLDRFALESVASELESVGHSLEDLRGAYLSGVAHSLTVMLELVREILGDGPAVPYERAVRASTGESPAYADTSADRERVQALLGNAGFSPAAHNDSLVDAANAWRKAHAVAREDIRRASSDTIPRLEEMVRQRVMPHLPEELQGVPRSNITFLPIENAWFSGSMNYLGRARREDGSPEYEATYEINASLEISAPEFEHLVSHEVVPGHVTTFAFLQHLYHIGMAGFEATIQTMNTRASTLSEGLANNAILFALGVSSPEEIEDETLQLGVLLSLMQDKAKNNASYLLYAEKLPASEVEQRIRKECLLSEERAGKLAGAWGSHPILGRMYLPSYHVGTRVVGELLRSHGPELLLPAIYGCRGVLDIVTLQTLLKPSRQRPEK